MAAPDAAELLRRFEAELRRLFGPAAPERIPPDLGLRLLRAAGLEFDPRALEEEVAIAMRQIERSVAAGQLPDEALFRQAAGSVERALEGGTVSAAKGMAESYQRRVMGGTDPGARYFWQSVADGRVCDSCRPRHGQVRTLAEWEELGPPRSLVLVCNGRCRCVLVPLDAAGKVPATVEGLPVDRAAEAEIEGLLADVLADLSDAGAVQAVAETRGRKRLGPTFAASPFDIAGAVRAIMRGR